MENVGLGAILIRPKNIKKHLFILFIILFAFWFILIIIGVYFNLLVFFIYFIYIFAY